MGGLDSWLALAYLIPLAVILCAAELALIWIQLERAIHRLDDIASSLRQMPAGKQADLRGEAVVRLKQFYLLRRTFRNRSIPPVCLPTSGVRPKPLQVESMARADSKKCRLV